MMSEYATIEHYVNHVMDEITKRDVEQVSERLRALGWEEVVRCRDCKHYMDYEHEYEPNLGYCREHDREEVHSMRFCAWGERRES